MTLHMYPVLDALVGNVINSSIGAGERNDYAFLGKSGELLFTRNTTNTSIIKQSIEGSGKELVTHRSVHDGN